MEAGENYKVIYDDKDAVRTKDLTFVCIWDVLYKFKNMVNGENEFIHRDRVLRVIPSDRKG